MESSGQGANKRDIRIRVLQRENYAYINKGLEYIAQEKDPN